MLITRLAPGLPPLIPASRLANPDGDNSLATAAMASSTTLNPLKSRHVMTAFRVVNEASQVSFADGKKKLRVGLPLPASNHMQLL